MLDNSGPTGTTPLAECINAVGVHMEAEMESIIDEDQRAYLVLVTDGLPDVRYETAEVAVFFVSPERHFIYCA